MKTYLTTLATVFKENGDAVRAQQQKTYMKGRFSFFGITSPDRKQLQKPFLQKEYLPSKQEAFGISKELWRKSEREYHYFAIELVAKYKKQAAIADIVLYEHLIIHQSWWDTVDFIASNLVGNYFIHFPEQQKKITDRWLASNNIWLQRSCLIYQLKYKNNTNKNQGIVNTKILSHSIESLLGSKEFFINKAIGWALRQYSRENPDWVVDFVAQHPNLDKLSKREALRLL